MAPKLVIGNWKLHGTQAGNEALLRDLIEHWAPPPGLCMVVCPPAPYLAQVAALVARSPLRLGAQDVSDQQSGAFTGEVSARMLVEFGCRYVLVGHSERRARHGETDERVAAKTCAALEGGLIPVVCIGETTAQHADGSSFETLRRQVAAVLAAVPAHSLPALAFAYEPRWAIGTGQNAAPDTVQEVHAFVRSLLAQVDLASAAEVPILYGGSVKAANAAEYAAQRDVDGVLVGGASLQANEFLAIGSAFLPRR